MTKMGKNITRDTDFKVYFRYWIKLYKEGAVRRVTLNKYWNNLRHIELIAPSLKLGDLNRTEYQNILNKYAEQLSLIHI